MDYNYGEVQGMALFFSLILSYAAVRGFRFRITETGFSPVNLESFNWLIFFIIFTVILYQSIVEKDRRLKVYASAFSVIIAVFYVLGLSIDKREELRWIWSNRSSLLNVLNLFYSETILYYCFSFLAFRFLKKAAIRSAEVKRKPFALKNVFIFWALFLIIYIPWYLYCYPGILTYDSGDQVRDALSTSYLLNANPAFVTLLIRAILVPIKKLTGSVQIGIGICTLLQMLILTFIFSLTMERISRCLHHPVLIGLAFCWYAFYPVNNLYSVTMWKDILFSACLLGFLLCLDNASEDEEAFFTNKRECFLLFITMLLLPLLRHNGIFITLMMTIYMFFRFRKFRKKVMLCACGSLAFYAIWQFVFIPAVVTDSITPREMLSVPLQQIARVLREHRYEMNPEDSESLQAYFTNSEIWNEYDPRLADNVKRYFDNDLFTEDPMRFFRLWAKIGKIYPMDYWEAFLQNNYGYWYPETKYWISSYGVIITGHIEDVKTAPVLKLGIVDRIFNWYAYQKYLKVPLLPLLFSRGACFWVWVLRLLLPVSE